MPHMRTAVAAVALSILLTTTLAAQPAHFGDPFPLTNTRYGAFGANPQLIANGRDVFLAWRTTHDLRITRLADGEKRVGHLALADLYEFEYGIVWTGTHFLLAATKTDVTSSASTVVGRLIDATGEPIGAPFELASGRFVSLATDGENVLMVYTNANEARSRLLTLDGQPAGVDFGSFASAARLVRNGNGYTGVAAEPNLVRVLRYDPDGFPRSQRAVWSSSAVVTGLAVANSPSDALVVWTDNTGGVHAVRVRLDGLVETAFTIATEPQDRGAYHPSVVWNGATYSIAYTTADSTHFESNVPILRVDAVTHLVIAQDPPGHALLESATSLAVLNGHVTAAWQASTRNLSDFTLRGRVLVRDAATAGDGATAAISAQEQRPSVTASSQNATLVVWSELGDAQTTMRAGLRQHDGSWSERALAADETPVAAASDGNGFAAIVRNQASESSVLLFDTRGRPIARSATFPFGPVDLAWNGSSYVAVGANTHGDLVAAQISTSGVISTPVVLHQAENGFITATAAVAFGGENLLVTWLSSQEVFCFPVCDPTTTRLDAVRLTPALQLLDAAPLTVDAIDGAGRVGVAWDGDAYAVVWRHDDQLLWQRFGADGVKRSAPALLANDLTIDNQLRVCAVTGGVGVTNTGHAFLVARDGHVLTHEILGPTIDGQWSALPGGAATLVYSAPQLEAPHHGSQRLWMRIADTVPLPQLPAAPRVSALPHDNVLTVEWTAPPQSVNGYRIEYHIDDGTWNEVEGWYDASTHAATVRLGFTRVKIGIRVRAFNDAGAGPASVPAIVLPTRRRAVR
jgi:hypothetical protein